MRITEKTELSGYIYIGVNGKSSEESSFWCHFNLIDMGYCSVPELQALAFDPAYASNLAATLEMEHEFPMVKFTQKASYLSEPIEQFEVLILQEKIRHQANPCMDWMVANAHLKSYPSGLCQIVKPGHSRSIQRIDGVDAAVIGLAMYLQQECIEEEEEDSVYTRSEDERGVFK